jgi:hypothetical protein
MEEERRSGELRLFPVRLDDFIFTDSAAEMALDLPANLKREDWLGYLRNYHVPSFAEWKNHDSYNVTFQKLLRDLRRSTTY